MNASEPFKRYAEKVCEQIRWKKAHGVVAKEIENHLIDQKNAYMDMGDPESIAEEKALLQMGDPVTVGAALDNTHKPAPQWGMIGLVMGLFAIGAFIQFLFSTKLMDESFHIVSANALFLFLPLSLAAFVGTYFLDFSFFGKHPYILPILILAYEVLSQMFGAWYGGQRGLAFGPFSISPISMSLLFPLAFCGIFYHFREKGKHGYFLGGLAASCFCVQLLLFHTFSGLLLFTCTAGILMVIGALRKWFGENTKPLLLFFIIAGIVIFALLFFGVDAFRYRLSRIQALLTVFHPETDPYGAGYFPSILQRMLKNSVFLGEGAVFLDWNLYEAFGPAGFRSDYLLTFLTYRYGWAVSIGLVLLLAVFLILGFCKCLKQKSVLGQMVSLCILATFTMEILVYIIVNLGYPLIAPIALPFLSYGTTALLLNMALAGILLSVFRTGEVYQDNAKPVCSESKFIQWDDGKLIISFKNS
ncbi:MAG: FtsW/RodA/SpoVE family cell cycle protein [Anaerotignum sp.]